MTRTRYPVLALAAALLLCAGSASASVINAHVTGCVPNAGWPDTCTVQPIGGPVAVDPLGFTLDVQWGPDYLWLTDDILDAGAHGPEMWLYFTYTGTHDGTENMGPLSFLDAAATPIATVDCESDDVNAMGGNAKWTYYMYGQPGNLHGFSLGASDGSGVTTMYWTGASIEATRLVRGPEPGSLLLLGLGLGCAVLRRTARRLV